MSCPLLSKRISQFARFLENMKSVLTPLQTKNSKLVVVNINEWMESAYYFQGIEFGNFTFVAFSYQAKILVCHDSNQSIFFMMELVWNEKFPRATFKAMMQCRNIAKDCCPQIHFFHGPLILQSWLVYINKKEFFKRIAARPWRRKRFWQIFEGSFLLSHTLDFHRSEVLFSLTQQKKTVWPKKYF